MREKTGARVIFPSSEDTDQETIVIIGKKESVDEAKKELESLIKNLVGFKIDLNSYFLKFRIHECKLDTQEILFWGHILLASWKFPFFFFHKGQCCGGWDACRSQAPQILCCSPWWGPETHWWWIWWGYRQLPSKWGQKWQGGHQGFQRLCGGGKEKDSGNRGGFGMYSKQTHVKDLCLIQNFIINDNKYYWKLTVPT